jgi:hypothetical protein
LEALLFDGNTHAREIRGSRRAMQQVLSVVHGCVGKNQEFCAAFDALM